MRNQVHPHHRRSWKQDAVLFGTLWLSVGLLSSNAWAQECMSDSDCDDPKMFCQWDDDPAPCSADGECPEPESGTCVVDALLCETDADCEEGFMCEVVASSSGGCEPSPDGGCVDEPVSAELRRCVFAPLGCETDEDCAPGLTCGETEVSCAVPAGVDGGTSDGGCDLPAERTCGWEPVQCSDDADCGPNEECVGEELQTCSVSSCAPGEACEPVETCEAEPTSLLCFPTQRACEGDSDCESGEVCFDLSSEDAELPSFWEQDLGTEFCLTEGIVLAIQGRARVGGVGVSEGEDASGDSASKGQGSESDDESAADGSPAKRAGGCSVTGGAASPPFGGLLLAVFGLWVGRRGDQRTIKDRFPRRR